MIDLQGNGCGSIEVLSLNFTPASERKYKNHSEEGELPDRYPNREILGHKAKILH
jgi:hypothetical protein